jgi:hypothetical protein
MPPKDAARSHKKKTAPEATPGEPKRKKSVLKVTSSVPIGDTPASLKQYITPEIWARWSPERRASFLQITKNPNSFFYRNRPPGDPQRYGSFTKEEEELFIERLSYFRNLGVEDGLWGLFAVPMRGRLGYQCSNFYRLLVKDHKVEDDRYEVLPDGKLRFKGAARQTPQETIDILVKEAMA